MTIKPTTVLDSTQVEPASTCGEKRARPMARSFSADARVASPRRVKRNHAHIATAITMTTPVSHRRSREKLMPAKSTGSFGRIGATARGVLVNCITMRAWIASSTPTDATTRARIGARRRGRNTRKCTSSPMRLHDSTASTNASAKGTEPKPSPRLTLCGMIATGSTKSPVRFSSSKTYAPHIAIAPVAKLMMPVPR